MKFESPFLSAIKVGVFVGSMALCLSVFAADEGRPAPDLSAKLFDGSSFSLSSAAGKTVIVHFWATWCAACQKEMADFDRYFKKHKAEGLRLIAISMDDASDTAKVRDVMKKYSFDGAMAKDASFKGYGRIWRLPVTFVIDRHGILRKADWNGEHGIDTATLEQTVSPILGESK